MKHVLTLCALLLLVTDAAAAPPHRVKVDAGNEDSKVVADALKARLNATERYQTTENMMTAELAIQILCTELENYKVKGAVCSYSFLYAHPSAPFLLVPIPIGEGTGLLSAAERGTIGEMIFQFFVEATTELERERFDRSIDHATQSRTIFQETTGFIDFARSRDSRKQISTRQTR